MLDRENVKFKRRIAVDNRKKIKTGYKGKDNLPKKAYHFVIQHPETKEEYFPELIHCYGKEPNKLFITFPSDNIEEFYEDNMNKYNKKQTKTRTCNLSVCTHFKEEEIFGEKFEAGSETDCICKRFQLDEIPDKDTWKILDDEDKQTFYERAKKFNLPIEKYLAMRDQACKPDMHLRAYIINPHKGFIVNVMPYLFENHSIYTINNIYDELVTSKKYKQYMGIIFILEVKKCQKGKITFPIWNIYPFLPGEALLEANINLELQGGTLLAESFETNKNEVPEAKEKVIIPAGEKKPPFNPEVAKQKIVYESLEQDVKPDSDKIKALKKRLSSCLSETSLEETFKTFQQSDLTEDELFTLETYKNKLKSDYFCNTQPEEAE